MSCVCGTNLSEFDLDFVDSPRRPSRSLSKNTLSFFLHQVILDAGAMDEGASLPWAHSVLAVAALAAFLRNWSVSKVLKAATWKSNTSLLHFICVTYRIYWITAILSSLSLLQVPFYDSAGLCFVVFRVFIFFCMSVIVCYCYVGIACFPCGTYVFSLGLACARHMTDHGLGPFPSSSVHCQTWTSCDQLADFGPLWHT